MNTYIPIGLAIILAVGSGAVAGLVLYFIGWRHGVDAALRRPRLTPDGYTMSREEIARRF